MSQSAVSQETTSALTGRARTVALDTLRTCERSAALIMRGVAIMQAAAVILERSVTVRAASSRARGFRMLHAAARSCNVAIPLLPLSPPMLLQLASDFRTLADGAGTPESSAAFRSLAHRFTALASGFDTEEMPSRMLH